VLQKESQVDCQREQMFGILEVMGVGGQAVDGEMARRERSAQLSDEIAERAAHIHSATAGLALMVAEIDDLRDWRSTGFAPPSTG
jgi:hypothetical protein